ncbi:MAG: CpsD/CapB family tyrosine-protein kinase [Acidobacteriia bacterium]|nr:CpsD/CapB family tyrosine-protein kinase [Terriglobia bacterium]
MSRTFEALQQIEKEQQLAAPSLSPARPTLAPPLATARPTAKSVRVGEEEVLKLVQRVFRSTSPDAPHVVVFSGVGHGDGCSWITASAALTLAAQTTASICVVDANLRTPSLHRSFDIENHFGLVESIAQPGAMRNFARQVSGSNLWVLTCGSLAPQSPAAPLSSEGLRARMADLRAEFDYVLIDTPPTNLYADAITLGRLSDGMILVLQSNATKREAAMKAKESCEIAQVRLLGAVLNKRTFPIPQQLYDRL